MLPINKKLIRIAILAAALLYAAIFGDKDMLDGFINLLLGAE